MYPPDSAMAVRFPTRQTRSIPSSTIGSNSISNPVDKSEEDKIKQAKLDALQKSYEAYNLKQEEKYKADLEKYKADVEKYNQEKIQYEKDLAEYNKLVEQQNQQKKLYDQALAQQEAEKQADHVAFKYYSEGRNVAGETPLVRKYYDYYVKREDLKRATALMEAQNTVSGYEKAYNSLDSEIKVYFTSTEQLRKDLAFNPPKVPEGQQGVSTPEGIYFEDLPQTTTLKPISPTVVRPSLSNSLNLNQQNVFNPPSNPINNFFNNNPVINPQSNLSLNQINKPPQNLITKQFENYKPIKENTYSDFTQGNRYISGTLDFLSSKSRKLVKEQPLAYEDYSPVQMRGTFVDYTPEQKNKLILDKTERTKNAAEFTVRYTPYFVPYLGAGLMIGEGTESFITKGGRAKIKEQITSLSKKPEPVFVDSLGQGMSIDLTKNYELSKDKTKFISKPVYTLNKDINKYEDINAKPKFSKEVASVIAYSGPVLNLVGGTLLLRTELKALRQNTLLNQATNKVSKPTGTIDYATNEINLISTKRTTPNVIDRNILGIKPKEFTSEIKVKLIESQTGVQEYRGTQINKVKTIDKLKQTIDFTGKEIKVMPKDLATSSKIINPKNGKELPLTNVNPSISTVYSQDISKGFYTIETNPATKLSKNINDLRVQVTERPLVNQPVSKELYLGVSEAEGQNIKFISGKIENVNVNKDIYVSGKDLVTENRISVSGKIREYGKLKGINTVEETKIIGNAPADYSLIDFKPIKTEIKGNIEIKPTESSIGKFFNEEFLPKTSQVNIQVQPKFDMIGSTLQSKAETSLISKIEEVKPSLYSGKGTYEKFTYSEVLQPRTSLKLSQSQIPSGSFTDITGSGSIESLGVTGGFASLGVQSTSFDNLNKVKPIVSEFNITKLNEFNKSMPRESFGQPLKSNQIQSPKLETIQKPKTEQVNIPSSSTDTVTVIDNIIKTPLPVFARPKKQLLEDKKKLNIKKITKGYNVLRRSKGKIEIVGKNLPIGKATKLGVDISKGSLSQTFALKESGYTQDTDINYKLPTQLFTAPKLKRTNITNLTFTERRGKTLTERKEVSLLQKSKGSFFK